MREPEISIRKLSCIVPVAVDSDGTPLSHGERMIENEPGVWVSPDMASLLADGAGRVEGDRVRGLRQIQP